MGIELGRNGSQGKPIAPQQGGQLLGLFIRDCFLGIVLNRQLALSPTIIRKVGHVV
jgi:hypothetical protein